MAIDFSTAIVDSLARRTRGVAPARTGWEETAMSKRLGLSCFAVLALAALQPAAADRAVFPDTIALPNGFRPEGISIGRGTSIYVGSIPTGAIFKADLVTGQGAILVPPQTGRAAIGTSLDP